MDWQFRQSKLFHRIRNLPRDRCTLTPEAIPGLTEKLVFLRDRLDASAMESKRYVLELCVEYQLTPGSAPSLVPAGLDAAAFTFPFERLPPEILHNILSCLCYEALIAFSCTSGYLHNAVNPQIASEEDKRAFVRNAEMYFLQHFPIQDEDWPDGISENSPGNDRTGNFACYSCFRVRGSEHFLWDSDDIGPRKQGYASRRVCTHCIPCAPVDIFFGR